MSDFSISIKTNLNEITKALGKLAYEQVPFATALALSALAKRVQAGEVENLKQKFPTATPFTLKSIGMRGATKNTQTATVFVKDIAAAYLLPYETGGKHKLVGSGVTWLNPKNIALDAYGNIPRGALRSYRGRKDVFIGPVKTKNGEVINGVWQRPARGATAGRHLGKRALKRANLTGRLKLIVRFGDAITVRQRLDYFVKAQKIVDRYFNVEFGHALAKAIATAK